jgi:hypothetical protein
LLEEAERDISDDFIWLRLLLGACAIHPILTVDDRARTVTITALDRLVSHYHQACEIVTNLASIDDTVFSDHFLDRAISRQKYALINQVLVAYPNLKSSAPNSAISDNSKYSPYARIDLCKWLRRRVAIG